MTGRRSSTVQKSTKSSSPMRTVPIHTPPNVSVKNFIQSCPYRIENIDRNAIIKRQDMEASLKRLSIRDDVYGVIVTTIYGHILYECETLKNWIPNLASLSSFARHLVRTNDPDDNISALRLRTKTYEIIITVHNEQLLIVMQMLSIKNNNNDAIVEEDWETFLQRIQQQKDKN
ncbi:unnamed protein product [Adineta steineri]|uniref:Roadblock/LAMTOR2 domain-containing protein n=1 Tax=Adineta steineri TaxID=433720 RepID=A0A819UP90_9BILA|nr:unnamed protein product [Adineta steineri]